MGLGKWIGGALGFITMGPLGLLAGVAIGSLFDKANEVDGEGSYMGGNQEYGYGNGRGAGRGGGRGTGYGTGYGPGSGSGYGPGCGTGYRGQRNSFLFSLLVMASYIIKADGKVMHSEMEYVRRFLRMNFGEQAVQEGEQILMNLFAEHKRMNQTDPLAFKNLIVECGAQIAVNMSYEERLQLLAFLVQIAQSDGSTCMQEVDALKEVARAMRLSEAELNSMLSLKGDSLEDAYKVLEVTPDATDSEVRAAYRKLALKHHPDRVATLGEDVKKAAEEKFQQINAAKERVYKARGMK